MPTKGIGQTEKSLGDDGSWDMLIKRISKENVAAQRKVMRELWRLQAGAFRQLRQAFDDPEHPASWNDPFLELELPIPFEWNVEIPLSEVGGKEDRAFRDLAGALEVLTAGIAVEIDGEELIPLLPVAVKDRLRGFSGSETKRCLEQWIDTREWLNPTSYGDNNLADVEDRTIRAWSRGRKQEFMAALWFHISPRFINFESRESFFLLSVGLPWFISEESTKPDRWSLGEQDALWEIVASFFQKLARARKLTNLPDKIVTECQMVDDSEPEFVHFEASFRNHLDVSYPTKTTPRPVEETPLRGFPTYALGTVGPELPISDGNGRLDPMAGTNIAAVMAHPDNEQFRRELLAKAQGLFISEYLQKPPTEDGYKEYSARESWNSIVEELIVKFGYLSPETFSALVSGPCLEDVVERCFSNAFGGAAAGDMLLYLLRCSEYHPEHLSVRKAAFVLSKKYLGSTSASGSPMNFGFSTIMRSWAKLRPVAHLWAAYRLLEQEGEVSDSFPAAPSKLNDFLAVSEEIRWHGQACFARAQKMKHGPILNPANTWGVPSDLVLPGMDLDWLPLSERTLRLLQDYRVA